MGVRIQESDHSFFGICEKHSLHPSKYPQGRLKLRYLIWHQFYSLGLPEGFTSILGPLNPKTYEFAIL